MPPRRAGRAGTVLVLTGTGFQTPQFDQRARSAYVSCGRCARPNRTGFHRANDRRRGALSPRTRDPRRPSSGRPLSRHDGGRSRLLPPYARRLSQRSRAGGRNHPGRSATHRRRIYRELGAQWAELAPSTVARRSAALRRFFGFLVDDGLRKDDPSEALPRPRFERPLPRILETERSRAHVRGGRRPRSKRRAGGRSQPRPARTSLWLGPSRERVGQPAARRGPTRTSRF